MRFLAHDVAALKKHVGFERTIEFGLKGIAGTRFELASGITRKTEAAQGPRVIDPHPHQLRLLVWISIRRKPKRLARRVADEKKFFFLERAFRELVRQRVEGCPVAYLVGRKEFFSLEFEVSRSVLIPRPESEFVVMECLRLAKPMATPIAIINLTRIKGL